MSERPAAGVLNSDVWLGVVFAIFGGFYAIYTLRTLALGTPAKMGSGFFPIVIAVLLGISGLAIAWRGLRHGGIAVDVSRVSWRAVIFISAATVVFATTISGGGLVVATALTVAVAGLASPKLQLLRLLAVTAFLAVFCALVFVVGLRLPIGLLGSWFK